MMISSQWTFGLLLLIGWLLPVVSVAKAQEAEPGQPIDYEPFFPDKWKAKTLSTRMIPWEGKYVVVLTTTADLDRKAMAGFLERLDAGWAVYADLIGRSPAPYKVHNGKATIAAVPDVSCIDSWGRGQIAMTGIEVAGFYKDFLGGVGDFDQFRKDPNAFRHYYFYEMGRNYFLFGDRHSAFTTGFAVFMRYVCMDRVGCADPEKKLRELIERAEAVYADSDLSFADAFLDGKGLKEKDGTPITPTDENVMVASVMLKLRKDYGGDAWVKRFYEFIQQCPPCDAVGERPNAKELLFGNKPRSGSGQAIYWVAAASAAAKQDLTPLFEMRWRFPLSPDVWRALRAVDWGKKSLSTRDVIYSLPTENLPLDLAWRLPTFVKRNLIVNGSFESTIEKEWQEESWRGDKGLVQIVDSDPKDGKRSLTVHSSNQSGDIAGYTQKVKVKPNTSYRLSAWIKSKDVVVVDKKLKIGANVSIVGGYEASESLIGSNDWNYVVLKFDTGERTEVEVAARIGLYNSLARGQAWFDDLCLIEMGPSVSSK